MGGCAWLLISFNSSSSSPRLWRLAQGSHLHDNLRDYRRLLALLVGWTGVRWSTCNHGQRRRERKYSNSSGLLQWLLGSIYDRCKWFQFISLAPIDWLHETHHNHYWRKEKATFFSSLEPTLFPHNQCQLMNCWRNNAPPAACHCFFIVSFATQITSQCDPITRVNKYLQPFTLLTGRCWQQFILLTH